MFKNILESAILFIYHSLKKNLYTSVIRSTRINYNVFKRTVFLIDVVVVSASPKVGR